jgi:hypothetical protein
MTTATGVSSPLVTASGPLGITLSSTMVSATGQAVVAGTFRNPSATFGGLTLVTTDQQTAFVARAAGSPLATKATASSRAQATLFPNPARRTATLRWPAPVADPLLITLFDALGHLVRQQTVPAHTAETILDLAHLSPGLYLVRVGTTTSRLAVE